MYKMSMDQYYDLTGLYHLPIDSEPKWPEIIDFSKMVENVTTKEDAMKNLEYLTDLENSIRKLP